MGAIKPLNEPDICVPMHFYQSMKSLIVVFNLPDAAVRAIWGEVYTERCLQDNDSLLLQWWRRSESLARVFFLNAAALKKGLNKRASAAKMDFSECAVEELMERSNPLHQHPALNPSSLFSPILCVCRVFFNQTSCFSAQKREIWVILHTLPCSFVKEKKN